MGELINHCLWLTVFSWIAGSVHCESDTIIDNLVTLSEWGRSSKIYLDINLQANNEILTNLSL